MTALIQCRGLKWHQLMAKNPITTPDAKAAPMGLFPLMHLPLSSPQNWIFFFHKKGSVS